MGLNTEFPFNRHQCVKTGDKMPKVMKITAGAPQGFVLSPILFLLYTNSFISTHAGINTSIFKYADGTAILGQILNNDESEKRLSQLGSGARTNI